jgi:hypothetical protein
METNPSSTPAFPFRSKSATCSLGALAGAMTVASSNAAIVYVNAGDQVLADTVPNNGISTFYPIDLDSNGVMDFRLRTRIDPDADAAPPQCLAQVVPSTVVGSGLGVIGLVAATGFPYAARLAAGNMVDGSAGFLGLTQSAGNVASLAYGPGYANSEWAFAGANSGYLGIRFNIGANTHYAWVRVTVALATDPQPRAFTLHEWAYESTPDAGIAAGAGAVPEASSLGLLALGSIGLAARRRRTMA